MALTIKPPPGHRLPRQCERNQQKGAINLLFDKVLVGADSKIKGVEPHPGAQPLFG